MDRSTRYFHEVATTGSLRKASERLHIASSAISRQIQLLEYELGTELFERAPQGMVLTQAGKIYLEYTHQLVQEADRVRSELDALKGLQRGHLRIISVEGLVADLIVTTFEEFRRTYPGITADIKVGGSHVVKKAIADREADIGISMSGPQNPDLDVALRIDDPMLAVMAPTHPLARSKTLAVQDVIEHHPIALPDTNFGIRTRFEQCIRHGKVQAVLTANSIAALRAFASLGGGITFLSYLAVRKDLKDGNLVGIPLSDVAFYNMTIDIVVAARRRLPLPAQELLQFLRRAAQESRSDVP